MLLSFLAGANGRQWLGFQTTIAHIAQFLSQEPFVTLVGELRPFIPVLAVITAALGLGAAGLNFMRARGEATLQRRMSEAESVPSFTTDEIRAALHNYVQPDCAQADPSEEDDIRRVADVRENVMEAVDRFVEHGGDRRFMLLLADTGMGKTTFCLNYYKHTWRRKKWNAAMVSLGRDDALQNISIIRDKRNTILLLDALDEDARAIENGVARISEIMPSVADFRAVLITCRSQFFPDDASVPSQTGVSIIAPRKAGDVPSYKFYRLYLMPFTEGQISKYISNTISFWNTRRRFAAKRLVRDIPELSARPMLLALIPDLIKTRSKVSELYDLYKFMVDQWLIRESRWISRKTLLEASKILAVHMYKARLGSGARISAHDLREVLAPHFREPSDFHFLTGRSLLNRDSNGRFKFAHRSIMEYLFVCAAIDGNATCLDMPWTTFITQLFVSWGRSADGQLAVERAKEILAADLRATRLFPLAPQLPGPSYVTSSDLAKAASGQATGGRRISTLPAQWREPSLRFLDKGAYLQIYDFEYDLIWRLNKPETFSSYDETALYRISLGEAGQRINGDGSARLPSLAEFASLLEAEQILRVQAIHKDELYWLGDQLGPLRYLVIGFKPLQFPDELLTPVELRRTSVLPIYLYEVAIRQRSGREGMFRAQAAYIISGNAESEWHHERLQKEVVLPP